MAGPKEIWIVTQDAHLVCGLGMKLSKDEALNKVENEARQGILMKAIGFRSTGKKRQVRRGDWHMCSGIPLRVEYSAPDDEHVCEIWQRIMEVGFRIFANPESAPRKGRQSRKRKNVSTSDSRVSGQQRKSP